MTILIFFFGLFLGGFIGMVTMALAIAADDGQEDEL